MTGCGRTISTVPSQPASYPLFDLAAFPAGFTPTGHGREELLSQLGMSPKATQHGDWPLLLHGAGNPISHLRIKEATDWLQSQSRSIVESFSHEDIAQGNEWFLDTIARHGLMVTGSSGVQGQWPKLLMTLGRNGRFYLDHQLPDAHAAQHYLIKFQRGNHAQLGRIFDAEAPYMQLAHHLGLRVYQPITRLGHALFIPRFDRNTHGASFVRHAQESLAAFCNRAGFEIRLSHDVALAAIHCYCSDPIIEATEYLCRDMANVVLGTKDNHARSTAFTRDGNGNVMLTPLFDFAPMYLQPDGVARTMHWTVGERTPLIDWIGITNDVASQLGMDPSLIEHCETPRQHLLQ